jgi:hypothetical protein
MFLYSRRSAMSDNTISLGKVNDVPVPAPEGGVRIVRIVPGPVTVYGTVTIQNNTVDCTLQGMGNRIVRASGNNWQAGFGTVPRGQYQLSACAANEGCDNATVLVS